MLPQAELVKSWSKKPKNYRPEVLAAAKQLAINPHEQRLMILAEDMARHESMPPLWEAKYDPDVEQWVYRFAPTSEESDLHPSIDYYRGAVFMDSGGFSYLLKEKEDHPPSAAYIQRMCVFLGIRENEDGFVREVAELACVAPLPDGWQEVEGGDFMYKYSKDGSEIMLNEHPLDSYFRELRDRRRRELARRRLVAAKATEAMAVVQHRMANGDEKSAPDGDDGTGAQGPTDPRLDSLVTEWQSLQKAAAKLVESLSTMQTANNTAVPICGSAPMPSRDDLIHGALETLRSGGGGIKPDLAPRFSSLVSTALEGLVEQQGTSPTAAIAHQLSYPPVGSVGSRVPPLPPPHTTGTAVGLDDDHKTPTRRPARTRVARELVPTGDTSKNVGLGGQPGSLLIDWSQLLVLSRVSSVDGDDEALVVEGDPTAPRRRSSSARSSGTNIGHGFYGSTFQRAASLVLAKLAPLFEPAGADDEDAIFERAKKFLRTTRLIFEQAAFIVKLLRANAPQVLATLPKDWLALVREIPANWAERIRLGAWPELFKWLPYDWSERVLQTLLPQEMDEPVRDSLKRFAEEGMKLHELLVEMPEVADELAALTPNILDQLADMPSTILDKLGKLDSVGLVALADSDMRAAVLRGNVSPGLLKELVSTPQSVLQKAYDDREDGRTSLEGPEFESVSPDLLRALGLMPLGALKRLVDMPSSTLEKIAELDEDELAALVDPDLRSAILNGAIAPRLLKTLGSVPRSILKNLATQKKALLAALDGPEFASLTPALRRTLGSTPPGALAKLLELPSSTLEKLGKLDADALATLTDPTLRSAVASGAVSKDLLKQLGSVPQMVAKRSASEKEALFASLNGPEFALLDPGLRGMLVTAPSDAVEKLLGMSGSAFKQLAELDEDELAALADPDLRSAVVSGDLADVPPEVLSAFKTVPPILLQTLSKMPRSALEKMVAVQSVASVTEVPTITAPPPVANVPKQQNAPPAKNVPKDVLPDEVQQAPARAPPAVKKSLSPMPQPAKQKVAPPEGEALKVVPSSQASPQTQPAAVPSEPVAMTPEMQAWLSSISQTLLKKLMAAPRWALEKVAALQAAGIHAVNDTGLDEASIINSALAVLPADLRRALSKAPPNLLRTLLDLPQPTMEKISALDTEGMAKPELRSAALGILGNMPPEVLNMLGSVPTGLLKKLTKLPRPVLEKAAAFQAAGFLAHPYYPNLDVAGLMNAVKALPAELRHKMGIMPPGLLKKLLDMPYSALEKLEGPQKSRSTLEKLLSYSATTSIGGHHNPSVSLSARLPDGLSRRLLELPPSTLQKIAALDEKGIAALAEPELKSNLLNSVLVNTPPDILKKLVSMPRPVLEKIAALEKSAISALADTGLDAATFNSILTIIAALSPELRAMLVELPPDLITLMLDMSRPELIKALECSVPAVESLLGGLPPEVLHVLRHVPCNTMQTLLNLPVPTLEKVAAMDVFGTMGLADPDLKSETLSRLIARYPPAALEVISRLDDDAVRHLTEMNPESDPDILSTILAELDRAALYNLSNALGGPMGALSGAYAKHSKPEGAALETEGLTDANMASSTASGAAKLSEAALADTPTGPDTDTAGDVRTGAVSPSAAAAQRKGPSISYAVRVMHSSAGLNEVMAPQRKAVSAAAVGLKTNDLGFGSGASSRISSTHHKPPKSQATQTPAANRSGSQKQSSSLRLRSRTVGRSSFYGHVKIVAFSRRRESRLRQAGLDAAAAADALGSLGGQSLGSLLTAPQSALRMVARLNRSTLTRMAECSDELLESLHRLSAVDLAGVVLLWEQAKDLSPDWLYDFRTYLRNHGLTAPLESKSTQTTAKTGAAGTAAKANKASQGGKQAQSGEGPKEGQDFDARPIQAEFTTRTLRMKDRDLKETPEDVYSEAPDELNYKTYRDSDVKHLKQRIVRVEAQRIQMGAKLTEMSRIYQQRINNMAAQLSAAEKDISTLKFQLEMTQAEAVAAQARLDKTVVANMELQVIAALPEVPPTVKTRLSALYEGLSSITRPPPPASRGSLPGPLGSQHSANNIPCASGFATVPSTSQAPSTVGPTSARRPALPTKTQRSMSPVSPANTTSPARIAKRVPTGPKAATSSAAQSGPRSTRVSTARQQVTQVPTTPHSTGAEARSSKVVSSAAATVSTESGISSPARSSVAVYGSSRRTTQQAAASAQQGELDTASDGTDAVRAGSRKPSSMHVVNFAEPMFSAAEVLGEAASVSNRPALQHAIHSVPEDGYDIGHGASEAASHASGHIAHPEAANATVAVAIGRQRPSQPTLTIAEGGSDSAGNINQTGFFDNRKPSEHFGAGPGDSSKLAGSTSSRSASAKSRQPSQAITSAADGNSYTADISSRSASVRSRQPSQAISSAADGNSYTADNASRAASAKSRQPSQAITSAADGSSHTADIPSRSASASVKSRQPSQAITSAADGSSYTTDNASRSASASVKSRQPSQAITSAADGSSYTTDNASRSASASVKSRQPSQAITSATDGSSYTADNASRAASAKSRQPSQVENPRAEEGSVTSGNISQHLSQHAASSAEDSINKPGSVSQHPSQNVISNSEDSVNKPGIVSQRSSQRITNAEDSAKTSDNISHYSSQNATTAAEKGSFTQGNISQYFSQHVNMLAGSVDGALPDGEDGERSAGPGDPNNQIEEALGDAAPRPEEGQ